MRKRIISLFTLLTVLMMTLTPFNAFALNGCDGVLDTGEIELESYIEWNTFKSNVDGLSEETLEELRSAEDRGILPEMYPVGTNKVVIKTDIGFYTFKINNDGSYEDLGSALRYAHVGSSKDNYVGTDAVSSGASDYGCCELTGVTDYGYYGDDFYVIFSNRTVPWNLSSSDIHSKVQKQGLYESGDLASGKVIYKMSGSDDESFKVAFHSWSTSGNRSSVSQYWGDTSYFSVANTWNSNGYSDKYYIMEYDFSKGLLNQTPDTSIVVNELTAINGGSVSALSGRFSANKKSIRLDRDATYPYGKFKFGAGSDSEDYIIWDYVYGWYDGDDNGVRNVTPLAGFVNMGYRLHETDLYWRSKSPQNYDNVGEGSRSTAWGTGKNVGSSQISVDQVEQLSRKLAATCNKNGIPFYALNTRNSNIDYSTDTLNFYSSRLSSKHTDGKTYHDGMFRLYKPVKPKLGTDGKYILEQTTTHYVSGGMGKNATRLTFSNISLGSDAKIEIYGNSTLLETITSAKNSMGTYTTPTYPYGEIRIVFTGGTSDSGRGEGFVLSKAEYGKFGVVDGDYTVENIGKVSVPKVGYSGLTEAKYPSNGEPIKHSEKINLSYSALGDYREMILIKKGVWVDGGTSYTYKHATSTSTTWTPGNKKSYIRLKDPNSGTYYDLTTSDESFTTSFYGPSGCYDVYGYVYGSGTGYNWNITLTGTEYVIMQDTQQKQYTGRSDKYDFSGFEQQKYTFNVSDFPNINTNDTTKLIENINLGLGDTVAVKVNSTNTYLASTSSYWSSYIYRTGTTNSMYTGSIIDSISGKYRTEYTLVNSTGYSADIIINPSATSNSQNYSFKDSDTIEVTIYKPRKIDNITLTKNNINKTTSTSTTKFKELERSLGYYTLFNINVVPGAVTSNYGYRFRVNGGTYYVSQALNNQKTLSTTSNYNYIEHFLYSDGYKDAIDENTKVSVDAYETVYKKVYANTRHKVGEIKIDPGVKDGYTASSVKVKMTLPKVSTAWYIYWSGTYSNIANVSTSTSVEKTVEFDVDPALFGKTIEIYIDTSSLFTNSDAEIPYSITTTYYDNADTEYKRYGNKSARTLTYNVITLDAHFTNIKIKEFNVPDGMTLTVNGTEVTSAPWESGWINKDTVPIVLSIPSTGDYGAFESKSMAEVIDYELQTKSIYDATSKESHTGVNLNEFKATTTTNSSGNTVNTCSYSSSTSITAATNAYVKIVSSLNNAIYSTASRCGVQGTISGLRGVTTINSTDWTRESFGDMGYIPTSSSTVTMNFTNVDSTTYSSKFYCPTGYAIKDWYMIKASNIPDSKIKTYQPGYQTIATGTGRFGDVALKDLADKGYTNVQVHSNVPITKYNHEDVSSSSSRYGSKKYGAMYYTDSNGTETLAGKWETRTINPNNYKCFRFDDDVTFSADDVLSSVAGAPTVYWTKYTGSQLYLMGICEYTQDAWKYYMPLVHINGAEIPGTCYNEDVVEDKTVGNLFNSSNPIKGSDGTAGGTFKLTMWTGDTQFEDGRYGVAKLGQDIYYSNQWYSTVQRVDVYRDYNDGTKKNIAMVPVSATDSFFITTGGINGINEEPPSVYHIGNDLMYIPGKAVDSRTDGNDGISMAWLRTGHWHLKGRPDEIEGITIGGVQNPVKSMDDDASADTQIIVPELDMDAESWTVGHKIKDGRVTEEKLSDDVKDKINEINLGSVTFIKDGGDQDKTLPVRNTYKSGLGYIEDCTLTYGGREVLMYSYGTDQIGVFVDGNVLDGLGIGSYIFKGTTTQGDKEINVVLQVNIVKTPSVDTTTTIEF